MPLSHHFKDNFSGYPYEMTRNTAKLCKWSNRTGH